MVGGPEDNWELGTRDTASYATFSDVVDYFAWLGEQVGETGDRRARIVAAGSAIWAHEAALIHAMLHGTGNLRGLADIPGIRIIGDANNPRREGLVSFTLQGMPSQAVARLRKEGIRVHMRKDDHYSGNVLKPLGLDSCVRVSMCHYNTRDEVARFLTAMRAITEA